MPPPPWARGAAPTTTSPDSERKILAGGLSPNGAAHAAVLGRRALWVRHNTRFQGVGACTTC
ncbi:MAG: hypothetical protein K0V04_23970 [Deltaproteobacteria bacterium]|nr:hypothetical protein [Deltaproteobacteria bacterium]